jgi:hypothetical protein
VIVRTSNLASPADADELVSSLAELEIEGISILFKDDETGQLFYHSSLPDTQFYAGFDENILTYLISRAREHGMRVNAWIPVFFDPVLVSYRPEYASVEKVGSSLVPSDRFASPVMPAVRNHELMLIEEIIRNFTLDGIRLDYIRFHSDFADMSDYARNEFMGLYGIDPFYIVPNTDDWTTWVDYRADRITTFMQQAKALSISLDPDIDVGAYLLPFSARPEGYHWYTVHGNNYAHYDFIKVMPMVYWQDWSTEEDFAGWVNEKIYWAKELSGSEVVPVFSVTDEYPGWRTLSEAEVRDFLNRALDIMLGNGIEHAAFFYYFPWSSQEFARIKKPVIESILPGRAQKGSLVCFSGRVASTEEVSQYYWESNISGFLNSTNFCKRMYSEGVHRILFRAQDPLGVWTPEVSAELEILPRGPAGQSPVVMKNPPRTGAEP